MKPVLPRFSRLAELSNNILAGLGNDGSTAAESRTLLREHLPYCLWSCQCGIYAEGKRRASDTVSSPERDAPQAVIGAGAAGLVTARELKREGHTVTVFEQSHTVGGVWNYSEDTEDDDPLGVHPNRGRVHSSLYVLAGCTCG